MLKDDGRRAPRYDGRNPIEIDYLSDSGDLDVEKYVYLEEGDD